MTRLTLFPTCAIALLAMAPARADLQAGPGTVIEVITAEVPASQLATDKDVPDAAPADSMALPARASKNDAPGELGSGIFSPFSNAALQRAESTGRVAVSTETADRPDDLFMILAALAGVVALALLLFRVCTPGSRR